MLILLAIAANFLAGAAILLVLDDKNYTFYKWVMSAPEPAQTFAVILVPMIWPVISIYLIRLRLSERRDVAASATADREQSCD